MKYMTAQNGTKYYRETCSLLSALSTVQDRPPPLQVLQLIPVLGILSLITGRRTREGGEAALSQEA